MDSELFPASSAKMVQFGILSPSEIREMSVLPVVHSETIENGKPKKGGLSDLKLGTAEKHMRCETCMAKWNYCPGHFGHLELAKPMFHVGFMKTVLSILQCICLSCSRILTHEDDRKFQQALEIKNPETRFNVIKNLCKNITICEKETIYEGASEVLSYHCLHEHPKLTIEDLHIIAKYKVAQSEVPEEEVGEGEVAEEGETKILHADMVLDILKKISDEDCQRLGFNPKFARPNWMILEVLPIPPPHVRPSQKIHTSRIEHDLTLALSTIISVNQNLKKQERDGAPPHLISNISELLQFRIATYFDNEIPGMPRACTPSERELTSICGRLRGKEGRVRKNLMGKRVHSSARTVITPDPTINIDEVGVPWSIAVDLTYPETVTEYNIKRLRELVKNGPTPPTGMTGAKSIITNDGRRLDLQFCNNIELYLREGVKVERHLQDGDLVILNRQPTLHKMSTMGHRIRIMPYSTFRLNMSVTSPYNADFDGDEMNIHVPQTFETRTEVSELMMASNCIVSPQANRPVMGIVQDTLLGCRKITKRDTFIEKEMLMNMLMLKEDFDGEVPLPTIWKPRPLWTGKQVFSVNIPKQINLLNQSAWHSDEETGFITPGDTQVRIERGILLTGTLCKKTLGTSTGSLVHVIWEDVGPAAAMKYLSNTQSLVNCWLRQHGFTFGLGDIITDSSTSKKIEETISEAKTSVKNLIQDFQENKLRPDLGKTMTETFENRVNQVLNGARDDAGHIAEKSLAETNNLMSMVTAGSTKGSFMNISQMTACVGQQNVEGKRIPFEFDRRTLPHFSKYDYGPESCGFVENSFLSGLTPLEFFFHAVGGRDGLIDTAVKIKHTGYMQRRLVKAMEDMMVTYDGTVRNSLGDVIQFLYGDDGMDAVYIESQNLDSVKMNKLEFDRTFKYEIDDENWNPNYLHVERRDMLKTNQESRNVINDEYQRLEADRLHPAIATNADCTWPLPLNIKRHIWNAQNSFRKNQHSILDLHPVEIVESVVSLQKRLLVVPGDDAISVIAQENATTVFNILLRSTLASKRVLEEYKLSRDAFEWVIGEIEWRFRKSLVNPGEMIGCVAGQSIGEPATQMTLRTVHYAGIGAKNVSVGIPRLLELINVTKTTKTPSLSVYLKPDFSRSEEDAKKVQCALECITLKNVTQATEIWYDPDPTAPIIPDDIEWVERYYDEQEAVNADAMSPWLIRIVLNREMMVIKNLDLRDIAVKILNNFDGSDCIYSDSQAENLILRIRFMVNENLNGKADEIVFLKKKSTRLSNMVVDGIPDINKVFIKQVTKSSFDEKDGFKESEEWMLVTEGVNLLAVMGNEGVDPKTTTSNHLIEIKEVLGIEAARRALINELKAVISLNGTYVNYRHLAILADTMTYRGYLMAITRHGINKCGAGPLMRCSFEETVKMLLDAAVHAETDSLRGVSGNVMLGQLAPIGTGLCDPCMCAKTVEDMAPDIGDSARLPIIIPPYSPTSPRYNVLSPTYRARSPIIIPPYSPTSPSYNLLSPTYWATAPIYHHPTYWATAPTYHHGLPRHSPSSSS